MTKPLQSATRGLASALACAALLTACGGGGDSGTVTITAKDGELIVIDAGSSGLAAKTYTLKTNYGASYAVYRDIPTGRLITVAPENADFDTGLVYLQGTPSKFLVGLSAQVAGAAMGTSKNFVCHSSAWTTAELNAISTQAASLPVCSNTLTIDEINRRATYANISLPALESGGKAVVISAAFNWPTPVLDPSLGNSGSGGGGTGTTTPAAPLAVIAPQVALNQVALGGRAGVSLVDADLYASVGALQLNGKALQVIQALTGPYAKLSLVSDPSDRKRFLLLLRTAEVGNLSQTSEYLCAGGNWSASDLDTLLSATGVQATACAGDIQFVDTSTPTVILNSVRVANRLSSLPATTVTTYLGTTTGSVNFQGFDKVAHLFQEVGLPALNHLQITATTGSHFSPADHTLVAPPNVPLPSLSVVNLSNGEGVELFEVQEEPTRFAVLQIARLVGTPGKFVLYMTPDGRTTVACRSASLDESQALTLLSDLAAQGIGLGVSRAPDVCQGVSYTAPDERLRMKDTVLTQKALIRGTLQVTDSTTVSANFNIRTFLQ